MVQGFKVLGCRVGFRIWFRVLGCRCKVLGFRVLGLIGWRV